MRVKSFFLAKNSQYENFIGVPGNGNCAEWPVLVAELGSVLHYVFTVSVD